MRTLITFVKMQMKHYAELHCLSCFSFLRGVSQPAKLVKYAAKLGYTAIAITDECSLAGAVKAHIAAKSLDIKLIIGSEFKLDNGMKLIVLAPSKSAYSELSSLISLARRRCPKGEYRIYLHDIIFYLKRCLIIWLPSQNNNLEYQYGHHLERLFRDRIWLGITRLLNNNEEKKISANQKLSYKLSIPMVACGNVQMCHAKNKPLHDVFSAIRHNLSVKELGTRRLSNAQNHLRNIDILTSLYPEELISETLHIASLCKFSLDELRYEAPKETISGTCDANMYLRNLVNEGSIQRWPSGVPDKIQKQINYELELINELKYEHYFLTVYDIVRFAREKNILCQGRGSAANSVICYCLFITEVSPEEVCMLFERFISRERNEPPDIDVDFEHERREEVIQYVYNKYGRTQAALVASIITYRSRSAIRDVGKALGLDSDLIYKLTLSNYWEDRDPTIFKKFSGKNIRNYKKKAFLFYDLVEQVIGLPRHLSQHVGGFIITNNPISTIVPIENANMPNRTIIQWDKEDIESLGLLKIDLLSLGMLSAIKKSLQIINSYYPKIKDIKDIPREDPATYKMMQKADTIGVFQIESRAQMSMLPRLKPSSFYDLVIEIAIIRPGPIQGNMVHPYLRRKKNLEKITYPSDEIRSILERTLGVPIFQEQIIRLAMVAAGFTGGEADRLRRAITNWGKNNQLMIFEKKLIQGMLRRGYKRTFAEELFEQIKGFGGYGFPESHAASFAILSYISAWIKCHHPGAFFTSLLNSQPMGFYSPSQLIQDAQRHGINILPIDVNQSQWDHQLLSKRQWRTIRLGFRLIKNLSNNGAARITKASKEDIFISTTDLRERAQLDQKDMEALAKADALKSITGSRKNSIWEILIPTPPHPLLEVIKNNNFLKSQTGIPSTNMMQDILEDYQATGLSLRSHPIKLLRKYAPFNKCKSNSELNSLKNKRFICIAGLVTCRQRPSTASGVLFLTLEDETGNSNVIVWPRIQKEFSHILTRAYLILVEGLLESREGVANVIATKIYDYSHALQSLKLRSRDFH